MPNKSMGIDLLTALIIQNNDVNVETYYSKQERKYGLVISRMERDNYRMLVSTEPIFGTKRGAKKTGNSLVKEIRELDLTPQKSKLENIMGGEETKLVSEVVKGVNG